MKLSLVRSLALVPLLGVTVLTSACGAGAPAAASQPAVALTLHGASLGGDDAIAVGRPAPDFSTVAHDGADVRISALRGRDVVLFFYSKDEAPGPIREATAFRDRWADLERRGVVVIGVSTDTRDAHEEFARRLRLPFHLVSDPQGVIARAYGVANPYGVFDRDTVLVGADGTVKKVYRNVDVAVHVGEVLADLDEGVRSEPRGPSRLQ